MLTAYKINHLPDLSLPKYRDLFGDEAFAVTSSRLFAWFQYLSCSSRKFTFTLRYLYDPTKSPSNQRLSLFILLNHGTGGNEMPTGIQMGETIAEILNIKALVSEKACPPDTCLGDICVLQRQQRLIAEGSSIFYNPARWQRSADSRQALEPFLDEAFAALRVPAFLDIQLSPAEITETMNALLAAMKDLEQSRDMLYYHSSISECYQAFYKEISEQPVCQMSICTGAQGLAVARELLELFAVETTGGPAFDIKEFSRGQLVYNPLINSIKHGTSFWQSTDGWYCEELRSKCTQRQGMSQAQTDRIKLLSQLQILAGRDLIQDLLTLPIPRGGYLRTFPLETELRRTPEPIEPASASGKLVFGEDLERKCQADMETEYLTKHAFVAGVTGSGKSMTMFNIVRQLAKNGTPFLVCEPVKSEYRGLARLNDTGLMDNLRVFTPGKEHLNPIRLNPFEFGDHITLGEHVANLMSAFCSALPLFEPMPTILEEAVWGLYELRGWNEDDSGEIRNSRDGFPTISELLDAVNKNIDSLGYDVQVQSNFKGAFRSRLVRLSRGSVGRFFDCERTQPSIHDLCNSQSVLELGNLSQEQANLATMFLLIAIREHLKHGDRGKAYPRLVLVLEEAHNLVPATEGGGSGENQNNLRAEASRYVSNMLAEMRAVGLGIIIIDQTPSAVSPHVIRNTNLKVAHRTVAREDRETLADVMLMNPEQQELLGRLMPGQAYIYAEQYYRPILISNALVKGLNHETAMAADDNIEWQPDDSILEKWLDERGWYNDGVRARCEALARQAQELEGKAETYKKELYAFADELGAKVEQFQADPAEGQDLAGDITETKDTLRHLAEGHLAEINNRLEKIKAEARVLERIVRRAQNRKMPEVADNIKKIEKDRDTIKKVSDILAT